MRIYNGGTFTNSYRPNALAPSYGNPTPSNTSYHSKSRKSLTAPVKPTSFPSVVKKNSFAIPFDEENAENFENNKAPVVNNNARPAAGMQKGLSVRSSTVETKPEPKAIEGGACHLVYEPDSSGRLVEHYSKNELNGMAVVGRWTAGSGKKIAGFKFKRNAGRQVLIGSCSAGVQGRKNYCNGFCQFVKQAKLQNGDVTLYDVPSGFKAMPVDVYIYYDDNRPGYQIKKLEVGESYTTLNLLAVCALPKHTPFYENSETVDLLKWLHDAEVQGYSSRC